ncbi:hypothetical protein LCGC14_3155570 [marine sediment metagenome]|uniref:Uncharacterized protein n=1 Tax=marine sediment metagenome TaxID=412755 RepID=A0A0F8XZL9_9ZZZZ
MNVQRVPYGMLQPHVDWLEKEVKLQAATISGLEEALERQTLENDELGERLLKIKTLAGGSR